MTKKKAMLNLDLGLSDDEDGASRSSKRAPGKNKKAAKDEGIADLLSGKDSMTMFGGSSRTGGAKRNSGGSSRHGGDMLGALMGGDPLDLLSREVAQRGVETPVPQEEEEDEEELRFRQELEREMGLAGLVETERGDATQPTQKKASPDEADFAVRAHQPQLDASNGSLDDIMGDILDDMDDRPAKQNKQPGRPQPLTKNLNNESRSQNEEKKTLPLTANARLNDESSVVVDKTDIAEQTPQLDASNGSLDDIMGDILDDMNDRPAKQNKHPGRPQPLTKNSNNESPSRNEEKMALPRNATAGLSDQTNEEPAKQNKHLGHPQTSGNCSNEEAPVPTQDGDVSHNDKGYANDLGPGSFTSNAIADNAQDDDEDWSNDFDAESPNATSMADKLHSGEDYLNDPDPASPKASTMADKLHSGEDYLNDPDPGSFRSDAMVDNAKEYANDLGPGSVTSNAIADNAQNDDEDWSNDFDAESPRANSLGSKQAGTEVSQPCDEDYSENIDADSPKADPTAETLQSAGDHPHDQGPESPKTSAKADEADEAHDDADWSNDFDADSPRANSIGAQSQNDEAGNNLHDSGSNQAFGAQSQNDEAGNNLHDSGSNQASAKASTKVDETHNDKEYVDDHHPGSSNCYNGVDSPSDIPIVTNSHIGKDKPNHHESDSPQTSTKLVNAQDHEEQSNDFDADSSHGASVAEDLQNGDDCEHPESDSPTRATTKPAKAQSDGNNSQEAYSDQFHAGSRNANSTAAGTQQVEDHFNGFDVDSAIEKSNITPGACSAGTQGLLDVSLTLEAKPKRRLGKAKAKPSPAPSQTQPEAKPSPAPSQTQPEVNNPDPEAGRNAGVEGSTKTDGEHSLPADISQSEHSLAADATPIAQESLEASQATDPAHDNDGHSQRLHVTQSRPPRPEGSLSNQSTARHGSSPAATRQRGPSSLASNREGSSAPSDGSHVSFQPSESNVPSVDDSGAENSSFSREPLDVELNIGPKPKRRLGKAKPKASPKPSQSHVDEPLSSSSHSLQEQSKQHHSLDNAECKPSSPETSQRDFNENATEHADSAYCRSVSLEQVTADMPSFDEHVAKDDACIPTRDVELQVGEEQQVLGNPPLAKEAADLSQVKVGEEQQVDNLPLAKEAADLNQVKASEPPENQIVLTEGSCIGDAIADKPVAKPSPGVLQADGSSGRASESASNVASNREGGCIGDAIADKPVAEHSPGVLQADASSSRASESASNVASNREGSCIGDAIADKPVAKPSPGVLQADDSSGRASESASNVASNREGTNPSRCEAPVADPCPNDVVRDSPRIGPEKALPSHHGLHVQCETSDGTPHNEGSDSNADHIQDTETHESRGKPGELSHCDAAKVLVHEHNSECKALQPTPRHGEAPKSMTWFEVVDVVPPKPSVPEIQIVDSTCMRVSWSPLQHTPAVQGYVVAVQEILGSCGYYDKRSGMIVVDKSRVPLVSADVSTIVVVGLAVGMEYTAAVAAVNKVGWSEFSAFSNEAALDVPSVLPQPSVEIIDHERACVSWAAAPASQGVVGYSLCLAEQTRQRYYDFGRECLVDDATNAQPMPGNKTSVVIGKLSARIGCKVRIAALNGIGWSRYSAFSNAFSIDVPRQPSAPTVQPMGETRIRVSWPPVEHLPRVTGYAIAVQSGASVAVEHYDAQSGRIATKFERSCLIPAHRNSIVVSSLSRGNRYRFKLAAKNEIGFCQYSSFSEPVTIDVPRKPEHPPALEVISDTKIRVSWVSDFEPNAISYSVAVAQVHGHHASPAERSSHVPLRYYDFKTGLLSAEIEGMSPIPADTASIIIGGLSVGVGYKAKLAVSNRLGWSRYSGFSESLIISEPEAPPQPAVRVIDNSSIHVSWKPVTGVPKTTGYVVAIHEGGDLCICRYLDSKSGNLVTCSGDAGLLPPDSRSAVVKGLACGTHYKAQIAVVNSVGRGHFSPFSKDVLLAETEEMRLWPALPINLAPGVPRPRTLESSCYSQLYSQSAERKDSATSQRMAPQQRPDVLEDRIESILRSQGCEDLERYRCLRSGGQSVVDAAVTIWAGNAQEESSDTHSSTLFVALNGILLKDEDEDLRTWMGVIKAAVDRIARPVCMSCSKDKHCLTVWRGSQLSRRQGSDLRVGEIIRPPMFVAASTSRNVAESFQAVYLVKLHVPFACPQVGLLQNNDSTDMGIVVLVPYAPIQVIEVGPDDIITVSVLDEFEDDDKQPARCFPI